MILDRIVADKRLELEARKRGIPLIEMQSTVLKQAPPLDFAAALRGDSIKLSAEVKKASPSKGVIRPDFEPVPIAKTYAGSGASAISVLTESRYFQGSIKDLKDIKEALGNKKVPLLRKDFIVDLYQVHESRAYGADAILLIVAILTRQELAELLGLSHTLGMSCLVEVHNESELGTALTSGARIIGINNRDLRDFTVDIGTTGRLRPVIPPDRIVVSESGIKDHRDVEKLVHWGVDAVLVGESLLTAPDIPARIKELFGQD